MILGLELVLSVVGGLRSPHLVRAHPTGTLPLRRPPLDLESPLPVPEVQPPPFGVPERFSHDLTPKLDRGAFGIEAVERAVPGLARNHQLTLDELRQTRRLEEPEVAVLG